MSKYVVPKIMKQSGRINIFSMQSWLNLDYHPILSPIIELFSRI